MTITFGHRRQLRDLQVTLRTPGSAKVHHVNVSDFAICGAEEDYVPMHSNNPFKLPASEEFANQLGLSAAEVEHTWLR